MNRARFVLGLVVFGGGILAGVLAAQLVNPPPPQSPWEQLPQVAEPAASAVVADLVARDDAPGLAKAMNAQLLQRLQQAIQPLVEVDEVDFTGAAERQGDILAGYVAGGRSQTGDKVIVGVVFRVRDGKVVGVN